MKHKFTLILTVLATYFFLSNTGLIGKKSITVDTGDVVVETERKKPVKYVIERMSSDPIQSEPDAERNSGDEH